MFILRRAKCCWVEDLGHMGPFLFLAARTSGCARL